MHSVGGRSRFIIWLLVVTVVGCATAYGVSRSFIARSTAAPLADTGNFSAWPAAWPPIPTYPRATHTTIEVKDLRSALAPDYTEVTIMRTLSYNSTATITEIIDFYDRQLNTLDWQRDSSEKWRRCLISEYQRTQLTLIISLTSSGANGTRVEVSAYKLPANGARDDIRRKRIRVQYPDATVIRAN